ncbi:hypothetical protein BS47DRAFT_1389607 [Hydnum rufescens UP504]|uniref:Uncharacterized protein n=1 Tax=Hydnum rufescens UP504 TaxID=1448309 RepID=A0A9P6E0X2_9AGAM|nr:hypothetical protein BS47DRAFT_1389607 [Hydnum rufescens UP504]
MLFACLPSKVRFEVLDFYFRYMKKGLSLSSSESFTPPDRGQVAKGTNSISSYHGFTGPVHAAFPRSTQRTQITRSSSAAAYLSPVESQRKGWTILVGQQVTKILFNPATARPPSLPCGVWNIIAGKGS